MTEARWREIHKRGQSGSVPRDDGFAFDPGDDEFNSSIHVMRTLKRRSLISKECENYERRGRLLAEFTFVYGKLQFHRLLC